MEMLHVLIIQGSTIHVQPIKTHFNVLTKTRVYRSLLHLYPIAQPILFSDSVERMDNVFVKTANLHYHNLIYVEYRLLGNVYSIVVRKPTIVSVRVDMYWMPIK